MPPSPTSLNINSATPDAELERQLAIIVRRYFPGKSDFTPERFTHLTIAASVLLQRESRIAYDRTLQHLAEPQSQRLQTHPAQVDALILRRAKVSGFWHAEIQIFRSRQEELVRTRDELVDELAVLRLSTLEKERSGAGSPLGWISGAAHRVLTARGTSDSNIHLSERIFRSLKGRASTGDIKQKRVNELEAQVLQLHLEVKRLDGQISKAQDRFWIDVEDLSMKLAALQANQEMVKEETESLELKAEARASSVYDAPNESETSSVFEDFLEDEDVALPLKPEAAYQALCIPPEAAGGLAERLLPESSISGLHNAEQVAECTTSGWWPDTPPEAAAKSSLRHLFPLHLFPLRRGSLESVKSASSANTSAGGPPAAFQSGLENGIIPSRTGSSRAKLRYFAKRTKLFHMFSADGGETEATEKNGARSASFDMAVASRNSEEGKERLHRRRLGKI